MANQLLTSLSEKANKSFIFFAFYSSLFSYAFFELIDSEYLYGILVLGSLVSCLLMHKNLFPPKVLFNGLLPEEMMDSSFDQFEKEDLEKEYLAAQIRLYNSSINENKKLAQKMLDRLSKSIYCILISFALFGASFIYSLL